MYILNYKATESGGKQILLYGVTHELVCSRLLIFQKTPTEVKSLCRKNGAFIPFRDLHHLGSCPSHQPGKPQLPPHPQLQRPIEIPCAELQPSFVRVDPDYKLLRPLQKYLIIPLVRNSGSSTVPSRCLVLVFKVPQSLLLEANFSYNICSSAYLFEYKNLEEYIFTKELWRIQSNDRVEIQHSFGVFHV